MNRLPSKSNLKTFLLDHGFSAIDAEKWAEFARQVLAIYWRAADKLLQPEYWEAFKQKNGALGVPKKKRSGEVVRMPIEDAITSEIGHFADELRSSLEADHFLRKHDVQFRYEGLVYDEKRSGRYSKKVDFSARSAYPDAPTLMIEAKPLRSKSDIQNCYFGTDGMGCFLTDDSPYTKGPLGAMLAYTITNTNSSMRTLVHAGLQSYKPAAITIASVMLDDETIIDCSHHDRKFLNLVPITILHLERKFPFDILPTKDSLPTTRKQVQKHGTTVAARRSKVNHKTN